ncbi:transporter substrate-binding domain-containing protein [Bordetella sp. N]|uniref:transporter substrate-binding domain-containing protein n=1 Tax=Bordetella sp. N TaxID=1746199 RepID=UPI00070DA7B1|nr:transporter substrate-binding domain-containing protein [Bordetella sp. N]ALM85899.1 hypothetical protein ASB57_25760 [Bordetella sp. N]
MNQINTQLGELAQGGVLRVGVVYAPSMSTFFVEVDEHGTPYGPTVDLGKALAAWAGCRVEFHAVPNSGELTDAVEAKEIDVAFMPMDDERKRRVAFGPSYFVIESTALVHETSNFQSTHDLNQKGVRVAGIANTTTIRNAARVLNAAEVIPVTSVEDAMSALQDDRVDAVVLSRDVLTVYEQKIPGSRVLDGTLHSTGIAVAVAKDRPVGLLAVSNFLERAKSSGFVRKIFDDAGFTLDPVAPSGM